MEQSFYFQQLYPLQDKVIQVMKTSNTGFYLTGGTALSRGYLQHRFSDDLDFFTNDSQDFVLWADRVINDLSENFFWQFQLTQRDERYVQLNLIREEINLKIELVNDVPSRVGTPIQHESLGWLDTSENILSNKITAVLSRDEPKDLADIWALCCLLDLNLSDAITGAQGKATGVFPVDLARVLCSVEYADWELVQWISPPDPDAFIAELIELGKNLILPNQSLNNQ